MERIFVGKTTEIMPGQMKKVSVGGNKIIVVNIDGDYFSVDDTCTHAGGSLSEGKLDDSTIICDWHGAQFECKNGKLIKFPAKINDLRLYKVVIESDDIFVET
jgi:nitrite reductase/ring-hydroxylating ferredoxin subunit|tara:strand:- start:135 stop:443 length:309 start_codon:yes stop_codon:yes gene_type:complete